MVLHEIIRSEQPISVCAPPRAVSVDDETLSKMRPIRHLLRDCRAAGRIEGHQICAAVACRTALEQSEISISLMQILRDEWGQAPVIFHPNAKLASFDEVWLLSLADAQVRGDAESAAFLLCSRLPRHAHRTVLTLVSQLPILE